MATTIPQRELRNQAGAVLRRAEQGERLAKLLAETPVDTGWARELHAMRDTEADA